MNKNCECFKHFYKNAFLNASANSFSNFVKPTKKPMIIQYVLSVFTERPKAEV